MDHVIGIASKHRNAAGNGCYLSESPFKWKGLGDDVLVVEMKANDPKYLERSGIVTMFGAGFPREAVLRRAPTENERRQDGVEIVIRPPTVNDVKQIWATAGSSESFLNDLITRERRQRTLDLRTPIVKEIHHRLVFDQGYKFIKNMVENGNGKGLAHS
jgi:hypothetical protein